jgi:hypothetical protein
MKKLVLILIAVLIVLPLPGLTYVAPEFVSDKHLPDAMQGVYYSTRIKASGSNPITLSFEPGDYTSHSFPQGLTMDKEGLIYGTPQKAGNYSFVVKAEDKAFPAHTTSIFYLTVKPYDENALKAGGTNAQVIGSGADDLTGIANAPNGGKAAMGKGFLFFVDSKGYLMQSTDPFRKAERSYGAVEYDCLDTLGNDLYYFHHYLETVKQKSTPLTHKTTPKKQYVTRIVQDSINQKGRNTLVTLKKRISNLSVTNEIVLYIQDGLLKRAALANGKESSMRAYAGGGEIQAASAFPYNGYAYFTGQNDGRLYRMPLDGQVAEPLSPGRVTAYTTALFQGAPTLFYADASQQLFHAGLDGTSPQALEGLKAGALNADNTCVYFTNALDNNRVYRLEPDSGVAVPLSESPAKNIYVFETHIAFEPQSGSAVIILPKEGGSEARLNR